MELYEVLIMYVYVYNDKLYVYDEVHIVDFISLLLSLMNMCLLTLLRYDYM